MAATFPHLQGNNIRNSYLTRSYCNFTRQQVILDIMQLQVIFENSPKYYCINISLLVYIVKIVNFLFFSAFCLFSFICVFSLRLMVLRKLLAHTIVVKVQLPFSRSVSKKFKFWANSSCLFVSSRRVFSLCGSDM